MSWGQSGLCVKSSVMALCDSYNVPPVLTASDLYSTSEKHEAFEAPQTLSVSDLIFLMLYLDF